jgi:hypothetical protein
MIDEFVYAFFGSNFCEMPGSSIADIAWDILYWLVLGCFFLGIYDRRYFKSWKKDFFYDIYEGVLGFHLSRMGGYFYEFFCVHLLNCISS